MRLCTSIFSENYIGPDDDIGIMSCALFLTLGMLLDIHSLYAGLNLFIILEYLLNF